MNLPAVPVEAAPGAEPPAGDEARKRAIARAVWTEIHCLMPAGRAVTIADAGDAISVEFGPPGCVPQTCAESSPIPVHRRRPCNSSPRPSAPNS